jgi:hypothetical protein
MPITRCVNGDRQLTTFTLTGRPSADELSEVIRQTYDGPPPTRDSLWDCRQAGGLILSSDEIRRIVTELLERAAGCEARKGGRTAVVVPTDLGFGMARMAQIITEVSEAKLTFELGIFRTVEEAGDWFAEERPTD